MRRRPRSIAGFPPPGPVTPATCIPTRCQVYGAPSDLDFQQLHGLNVARYHAGRVRGVPMACPGNKLLGCVDDLIAINTGAVDYGSLGPGHEPGVYGTVGLDATATESSWNATATGEGTWNATATGESPWSATPIQSEWNAGYSGRIRGRRARRRARRRAIAGGSCPQNVNDMRFSCQGYMGMMDAPQPSEGIELLLPRLLAGMRSVYMTIQTAHWQAGGEGYYGKHLMLQKIYEGIEDGYDALAERVVSYLGPWAVDPVQQNAWIGQCLQRWQGIACPIERSLAAALDFRHRLEMTHQILQQRGELSLGLENYIGEIAAGHDQHVYLLQRANASTAKQYAQGPYVYQGGHMGARLPKTCEEKCASMPRHSWQKCLSLCARGVEVQKPSTPRALPPAQRMHWASPYVNRPVATNYQGQVMTNTVPVRGGMRRVWRQG